MRPCRLSPAVFFALFASVAADALPPDAVPVMCAAICGPIVELSSMCSPKRSLGGLGGSRLDREEHHRQHMKRHGGGYVEEKENAKREFIIIVPAPTTFPPGLLDSPSPLPLSPTSALPLPPVSPFQSPSSSYIPPPASIQPVRASPTSPTTSNYLPPTTSREVPPPTPPTVSSAHPLTSSVVIMSGTTSSHHKSTLPTIIGSDGTDGGETGGWGVTEDAEEKCVCLNDSFNVAEIAGLCASCISMNADTQNSESSSSTASSFLEADQAI